MKNPFSKTFGKEPSNYIERSVEKEQIIDDFTSEAPSNYTYIITGPRGSGKTVLLSSISKYFENLDDWIVVDPGVKDHILENIASILYDKAKLKTKFLKGEFSFSFQGFGISIKGDTPVASTFSLLIKMASILKKKKKRILITIDEVDNSKDMKSFIEAYQSLIKQGFDVLLLMTGLYENISKLQDNPSLTFLYRAPKIHLGALSIRMICSSYESLIGISKEKAIEYAKITKGYAYAYQVLGSLLFESDDKELNEKTLNSFDSVMDEHVYRKIYLSLSNKEKEIVQAIDNNSQIKIAELMHKTNIDSKSMSQYRDKLIKRGVLISPTFGYVEFALPRFAEFLKSIYWYSKLFI